MKSDQGASDSGARRQAARVDALLDAVVDMLTAVDSTHRQLREEIALLGSLHSRGPDPALLADLQHENAQLKDALMSRGVIEQAKGVLAVLWKCTPEEAFTRLNQISRERRVKVRDLAEVAVTSLGKDVPDPRTDRRTDARTEGRADGRGEQVRPADAVAAHDVVIDLRDAAPPRRPRPGA